MYFPSRIDKVCIYFPSRIDIVCIYFIDNIVSPQITVEAPDVGNVLSQDTFAAVVSSGKRRNSCSSCTPRLHLAARPAPSMSTEGRF